MLFKKRKNTILVTLKNNSALKMYLFFISFHPNESALNSCLDRMLWSHFLNGLYCTASNHPGKIWVVSNFNIWLLFVGRIILKRYIVVIFMFLHCSSNSLRTKTLCSSSTLNDDFQFLVLFLHDFQWLLRFFLTDNAPFIPFPYLGEKLQLKIYPYRF